MSAGTAAAAAPPSSLLRQETGADDTATKYKGTNVAAAAAVVEARRRVGIFLQALMSAESFDKHTLQAGTGGRVGRGGGVKRV